MVLLLLHHYHYLLLLLLLVLVQHDIRVNGEPQVPCVFVFGDSLSDSGNNNQLRTYAKANYSPYGIDFPSGPTGRFTNGRTSLDIITEMLGFEDYIPPFANTSGSNILLGVNYASGASGIRNETGTVAGAIISLPEQMRNHRVIVSEIERMLGSAEEAQEYLKQCLYYVNIGNNDYLNNYFLPQYFPTSKMFSPEHYAVTLIQDYAHNLRAMHEVGGRKFALFGVHLLGCVPIEIVNRGDGSNLCVEEDNKVALLFNDKLRELVDEFNAEFSDSKFIFVNSALISSENPLIDGIRSFSNTGCCQVSADGMCAPNRTPCVERDLHIFYDFYHPTQAANHILATLAFKNLVPTYTHPMDISDLVQFQL